MIKFVVAVLFDLFFVARNDWVPFEFMYERRPDWCIDEDPLCPTLKGWCINANKTRENYMKKACRRTCHMCYEGMNNTKTCYDKEENCATREIDCFSEATAKRMYDLCPETCGFCNNICADLATNCAELIDYCMFSYWHQAVMQSRCRLTCSFCRVYDRENFEPTDCSDNLSYCRYRRNLCERIEHQHDMRTDCSYTCNFCDHIETEEDIPTECNDSEIDCIRKRHLCYVEGRHSYYMWRNCKRTCGYCPQYNLSNTSTDDTYDSYYYYY
ncbi:ShTK domain containing protein [Brugia malayi]|uniref:Bm6561 n=2 Tax=Brugia malayi TaxID=6279 RepID=A0A0H5SBI5_BRUMA|nr:ShTK domain containing protein [Brugia malayi]CRZ25927.1 Bm6561 [Brugia malayi]VIO86158.1 ShTK domain containing protein [Brugia malayi]